MSSAAQSVSILMLIAAAGLASVGMFGVQHRRQPGARGFAVSMFGTAAWTLVLSVNIWPRQFLPVYVSMTLRNGLILVILLGWLLLVVEYVQRERVALEPLPVALLLVVPVLTVVLTATNPLHHLVIGADTPSAVSGGPEIEWGPWHLVFMTYAFTISLAAAGFLVRDYWTAHGIHRRQLLLLLSGFAIGFVGVNDYLITGAIDGVPAYVRTSPFVFLLTAGLWGIAVFRHQLFGFVPISRQTVVDTMPDPVIAIDRHETIIDVNPAAKRLCDVSGDVTGMQLTEFCNKFPQVADHFRGTADSDEMAVELDGTTRHFSVTNEPVRGGDVGSILVLRDMTDRKAYELELEEQRDNLEVLNQVVRHDVRNELQLVLTYAEALEANVENDDEEYVRQVLEAARDAVDITKTARDVTEVMLQSDVDCHPVGLRTVLTGEVEAVQANHERAVVRIGGSLPAVEVLADEMLSSVFRNLLTNAIQHNDKDVPKVIATATRDDGAVEVRIADNGPGIPADRQDEIFEQGEKSLDSEGSGLGLYLVDTLVDRYGGDIRVEDNDPEGAVFVVELPLAPAD